MTPRAHHQDSAPERGRRIALGLALVALASLLLALWRSAERSVSFDTSPDHGTDARVARLAPAEAAMGMVAPPAGEFRRAPVEPERVAGNPEPEPGRATLSGRLQLDGYAPFRGRVHVRQGTGEWRDTIAIDPQGRFLHADVPATELRLSFEAEWNAERPLLLPEVEVVPAAGAVETVDLDWTTRHVNVQVVQDPEAGPARVELTGPDYHTSFATNELGKARLSLVGSGLFTFRAELQSGARAEAALELDEDQELETVVILPPSAGE